MSISYIFSLIFIINTYCLYELLLLGLHYQLITSLNKHYDNN